MLPLPPPLLLQLLLLLLLPLPPPLLLQLLLLPLLLLLLPPPLLQLQSSGCTHIRLPASVCPSAQRVVVSRRGHACRLPARPSLH